MQKNKFKVGDKVLIKNPTDKKMQTGVVVDLYPGHWVFVGFSNSRAIAYQSEELILIKPEKKPTNQLLKKAKLVDNRSNGKAELCKHCGGDIAIRNPKGKCDHLYYPENCEVCSKPKLKSKGKKELRLLTIQYEFPEGHSGTSAAQQYAYFLNEKNEVIKKIVKSELLEGK